MMAMCRELDMAWRCVEASLDGMKQNKKKKLYTLLMHGIKRAVEEKCKRKSENISDMRAAKQKIQSAGFLTRWDTYKPVQSQKNARI